MKHASTARAPRILSFGPANPEDHPLVWRWILGLPLPRRTRRAVSPAEPADPTAPPSLTLLPPPEALLTPPEAPADPQSPDPVEPAPTAPEAPVPAPVHVPEVIPMEATHTPPPTTDPEEETSQEPQAPPCPVPGCDGTRARARHDTDPSIRSWCAPCRVTVRQRATRQELPVRVVAKRYLAERGGEPETTTTSKTPAQTSKPTSKTPPEAQKARRPPRAVDSTPDRPEARTADAHARPVAVVPHHTPDGVLRVITSTVDVELPAELVRLQELAARAGGIERLDALVSAALALGGRS